MDLEGLKVSFVAGTLGRGGAERQLFYILQALQTGGAEVQLLSLTQGEFWEKPIRELGIPVVAVSPNGSKLSRIFKLVRAFRDTPALIIQSQHFFTNLYVVAIARLCRVREIGALRSDAISEIQDTGGVMGRLSVRAPRFIAANSRNVISKVRELRLSRARLHFLPNVIDTEKFQPTTKGTGPSFRVLAVGRLGPEKRFDRFLEIVKGMQTRRSSPVSATIVGSGPLRAELEARARGLGLAHVHFADEVTDMPRVYREADVLVLTSDFEGTPNVIMEAMASGLPVVASRVGGVPELIEHGRTGFLHAREGVDDFISSLSALAEEPDLRNRIGREARAYIVANHATERLPALLAELYSAALA